MISSWLAPFELKLKYFQTHAVRLVTCLCVVIGMSLLHASFALSHNMEAIIAAKESSFHTPCSCRDPVTVPTLMPFILSINNMHSSALRPCFLGLFLLYAYISFHLLYVDTCKQKVLKFLKEMLSPWRVEHDWSILSRYNLFIGSVFGEMWVGNAFQVVLHGGEKIRCYISVFITHQLVS